MKITYIYHSCFSVELKEAVLIFDYFQGDIPKFPKDKPIYMFASHKHGDHYDKKIFNLVDQYENIHFILSNDIKMNEKYMMRLNIPQKAWDKIEYVAKNKSYVLNEQLTIDTLRSTDEGVAFMVTAYGHSIYHAGDLNWWTWNGETKAEYEQMTKAFCEEINKIGSRSFEVAFLPLDPRQEDKFYLGFDYFMRHVTTQIAIPMHWWEHPEVMTQLKEHVASQPYRNKIVELRKEGDNYEL